MVVEAHPVDQGPVAEQAEGARSRVARLGVGGDGADLDMTEAQVQQRQRDLAVLVEAGGHAQRAAMLTAQHPLRLTPVPVGCGDTEAPSQQGGTAREADRKSTRLNSSHVAISSAVFCLKKTSDHISPGLSPT